MLRESQHFGLENVTVSNEKRNTNFHKNCGFVPGSGGVWQSNQLLGTFVKIFEFLANNFKKCYSKYELFLFGVKDSISKNFSS